MSKAKKEKLKSIAKSSDMMILALPVINIAVFVVAFIKRMFQFDINRCLVIAVFIGIFMFNIFVYRENKEYYKYKVENSFFHELWLLLSNLSRLFIYYSFCLLVISAIVNLFGGTQYYELFENVLVSSFAIVLIFHLVSFFSHGVLTKRRLIIALIVLYLASFSDIVSFFVGSAGAKLITDWLFSEEYINYIKLQNVDNTEKVSEFNEKMTNMKTGFKAEFTYIVFSLNFTMVIRKTLPTNFKSDILCYIKWFAYRGIEAVQDTQFTDRILIGMVTILVSLIWYFLLKCAVSKYIKKLFGLNLGF